MPSTIGVSGLILILILALVLFGPKKLPELGRAVGNTLKEFKNATRGLANDDDDDKQKQLQQATKTAATGTVEPDREQMEQEIREQVEREIREKLERERLEAEIRQKLEKERLNS